MPIDRELFIFDTTHKLTNHLLKYLLNIAENAIKARGRFIVALAGGKTPIEFYAKLAGFEDLEFWSNVHIFQTDERFVPVDSAESNYRMMKESLLDFVPIPLVNVHPFMTEAKDVQEATRVSQKDMREFFIDLECEPYFDLVILGIGEDGHTASLFPTCLPQNNKELVAVIDNSAIRNQRITLTFEAINKAKNILFLVTGEDKANIMRLILEQNVDVPANRVLVGKGKAVYFLDKDAARRLATPKNFEHDGDAVKVII
ncbi:MAG: 6-phosphogluconolactonase [Candidatus Omnitrophica bacterium]|nr:6-phosphogluconolactonase [Candidatus Omnitrophota bacterium]